MIHVPLQKIHAFVCAVLQAHDVAESDATIVADVLVAADRFGIDSHGIQRLGYYVERLRKGITNPHASPKVVRETPTTVLIDGDHALGHVLATDAMRRAMTKAKRIGLGAAAVRNSTHYGIAGHFALMAASEGMIGVATSNARPCQAATFGVEPLFGTNPLAVAAPSSEANPFLFDAGMCAVQRGRIELMRRAGIDLPEDVVVDSDGNSVTEPAEALRRFMEGSAAMLPLGGAGEARGGHKGFGIALVLELLNAALQDGPFLTDLGGGDKDGRVRPYRLGHFFLAIDVSAFIDPSRFREIVGGIAARVRESAREPGADRVFAPGDKEWERMKQREVTGVPLSEDLAAELDALHQELRLPASLRLTA